MQLTQNNMAFTPQVQTAFDTAKQGIKRKLKPLTDFGTDFVTQNVEAVQPAIQ